MQTSLFLARLLGPTLLVMGLSLVVQRKAYTAMVAEFLAGSALLYLAGVLAFVPGLAVVLTHNVWTADWRLIITLAGWLALVSGTIRLLFPGLVKRMGRTMLKGEGSVLISGIAFVILGAALSYFGFAPSH